MYQDDEMVREFLAGEYRSHSALTLGTEEMARGHEANGHQRLADIHRMPIDLARMLIIHFGTRYPEEMAREFEYYSKMV